MALFTCESLQTNAGTRVAMVSSQGLACPSYRSGFRSIDVKIFRLLLKQLLPADAIFAYKKQEQKSELNDLYIPTSL